MTSRKGYVTMWHRRLLVRVGHKKTAEIIKMKISMSQLGAAGSNGLKILFLTHAVKYLVRIIEQNPNSLLFQAFQEIFSMLVKMYV